MKVKEQQLAMNKLMMKKKYGILKLIKLQILGL